MPISEHDITGSLIFVQDEVRGKSLMMILAGLQDLIDGGESITVEFKGSHTDITKDVYETVCSFSDRDGGYIFLGVKKWESALA